MGEFTIAEISEHIGRSLACRIGSLSTSLASTTSRIARAIISGSTSTSSGPSAKVPFGGPIAHGYLMLVDGRSVSSMQVGLLPKDAAAGLNYGIDKARFLAPVPAGARVRLRVVLTGVEPGRAGRRS